MSKTELNLLLVIQCYNKNKENKEKIISFDIACLAYMQIGNQIHSTVEGV